MLAGSTPPAQFVYSPTVFVADQYPPAAPFQRFVVTSACTPAAAQTRARINMVFLMVSHSYD
ncbi:MAG: hypothetical protein BWX70_01956 [Verrucomicrobia bacterium ADurb.Bin070]|nr:MAG: hypothetical protein BWX70_01956 [Verrucomicrobia bacterium ADurb.Bin070]